MNTGPLLPLETHAETAAAAPEIFMHETDRELALARLPDGHRVNPSLRVNSEGVITTAHGRKW
jgi:hypothetical protein